MSKAPYESVVASIEVALDPATAFAIFTEEIGQWWRPGPINWNDSRKAVGIRIDGHMGGHWIEVHNAGTGEGFDCGRITGWEPGVRFTLEYRDAGHDLDDTTVEVRFDAVGDGTRVTLEHSGWEHVAARVVRQKRNAKRYGWANILNWYGEWTFWGSPCRNRTAILGGDA